MSLEALKTLAIHAIANRATGNRKTPMYELAVEEARKLVKIKDGNRKPAEDGSQALTLTLGRITLSLGIIAANASRITAAAEKIAQFTDILQASVDEGAFDDEIVIAQQKSVPKKKEPKVAVDPAQEGEDNAASGTFGTQEGTLSLPKTETPTEETQKVSDDGIDGLDFSGIE